ncbi:SoxS protein [Paracoccus benzoatiresistens]|uniref:SoxS protein n=1 Tax=Paracoccus benzoatiresistens TaxID=2997341 RepID=A0ABT4IZQ9_9RHOB|nr:SoxS protein [Paracoccus sp. EF6]MCZ0960351.1 SoxS protein [Paracoccus sp. EF6]
MTRFLAALALAVIAALPVAAGPLRLLMVEKEGCVYCAAWDRAIGPGYAASDPGRAAPLERVDIHGPYPDGLALARRPFVTPTFILLDGGSEVGRLEGHMTAQQFYPALADLLAQAGRS